MSIEDEPIDGSNLSITQVINKVKQADKQLRKAAPIVSQSELGTLLTDVQELKLDWLWDKRILRGKVTLLDGDPDLGKSLITLDLAARVTTGQPMPDGSPGITGNVILIAPEDDAADTIKPRILAAGGDPSRIRLLTMLDARDPRTDEPRLTPFTLPTHLTTLISIVQHYQAVLVIIDPLIAVLDSNVSVSNDQQMRNVLVWLDRLGRHANCAILLVRHLNKGSSANALHRGSGSVGIIASVRSSLLVVRDPYDEQKRILTVIKNNLSTRAPDLTYHITSHASGAPTIHWLGTSYVPLPTLLKNSSELSAGRQAILNVLRESAVPLGPKDIAELIGQKSDQVRFVLRRMLNAQELISPSYGLYTVHGQPSSTTSPQEETIPTTPATLATLETVGLLESNLTDTPVTPDTLEIVNHISSNSSDTSDTPATLATLETLEPSNMGLSNTSDTPATLATSDILETQSLSAGGLHDTSDTPETSATSDILEMQSLSDAALHDTSATLATLEIGESSNAGLSNISDTPATLATLATPDILNPPQSDSTPLPVAPTLEQAPSQTPPPPPIDLDSITNKIRTIFYCSRDNHYVQWRVSDTRRIGCPLCDSWLVRDTIYNPTILALYEILNRHAPHENEHRRTWLERIAPFIP